MGEVIKLAVREICEFLLQSGSIDNRFGGSERAALGSRIHRQLQKEGGAGYQSEISLSLEIPLGEFIYFLEGRADGFLTENGILTVDEIKTTGTPLEFITEEFDAAHWGQARCYAYIISVKENLTEVGLRLTYFNVDTGVIKRFLKTESAQSLKAFTEKLLSDYQKWAMFREKWSETRNTSIKSTGFPFPEYRTGQREMAAAVYRTIGRSGRLFCQAPTGIGKTVSAVFPSVKAMGEGLCERIFYLTAKTITRQAAEEAYALLRKGGLKLKTITLTAKDKVCFLEERSCNPIDCPYAEGYYDRAREATYEMICKEDVFSRSTIEEKAREFRVCPFELALDLSLWCDGIICDYNYLFDPVSALQRFFANKKGEYVFLVDEAHNLVDRARDMYSAVLMKSGITALKKSLGKGGRELKKIAGKLNTELLTIKKDCLENGFLAEESPRESLVFAVKCFSASASEWLEENKESTPLRAEVLDRFFEASFFMKIIELYDDNYCTFSSVSNGSVSVKLLCINPSSLLSTCMDKGKSTVLFSATLSPLPYYKDILGGGETAKVYSLSSPFEKGNLLMLSANNISTKYRDRSESLQPISRLLFKLISGRQGNYLAYFPSYKYMGEIFEAFHTEYPNIETIVQTGDMDEFSREEFLLRFDSENSSTLLGFCVLGGVFAEGVDLKGNRLIGSAVIGVGLPQIGAELDYMKNYFNNRTGMGFEYVYRFPGMNKVLQAAGRVIRGSEDRGVVLLIDSRFGTRSYQTLFPEHWSHIKNIRNEDELSVKLKEFWEI